MLHLYGGPKPQFQREQKLDQHGIILYWRVGGFLRAHRCFLVTSFNLAYNYATTVPARINQPSKLKHVHLYPNVIYLKCHVGASIMHYYIGFYFLLK